MTSTFPYEDMGNAIRAFIETGLGGANPYPVYYDNAPQTPPDGTETGNKAHLTVNILDGDAKQADTGTSANRHRRPFLLQIGIFTEPGKGDGQSRRVVDLLVSILREKTITVAAGTVVIETASPRQIGIENGWYRVDLRSTGYSDDFGS